MIRRMNSNENDRYFVRISMFPSNKNEIFKTDVDPTGTTNGESGGHPLSSYGTAVTRWNLQEFDWDHPSAILDFPLQGYLDAGGTFDCSDPFWSQVGIATIMRLPESNGESEEGSNWTFYLRNATAGVAIGSGSRRALGDPIRLVRDL